MLPQIKLEEVFTYGMYKNWPENERWEIINGVPYNMSPAPSRSHQYLSGEIFRQIANLLKGKKCKPYIAPFDVRLPDFDTKNDDDILTVVQPDISVICDEKKLDDAGCKGAPDFIIEILSPSTAKNDEIIKKELYEKHGVKEYWLVHPTDKIIITYLLKKNKKFGPAEFHPEDTKLDIKSLPGLSIDFNEVFKM